MHGLSTAGWWAREQDLPDGECGKRVRVATRIVTHFDAVLAAVGDERISWAHARVIADAANPRVLDLLVGLQSELIDVADGMLFAQWEQQVRTIVCRFDVDGGHNPSADQHSSLKISPTIDGFHKIEGWLTGARVHPDHRTRRHGHHQ